MRCEVFIIRGKSRDKENTYRRVGVCMMCVCRVCVCMMCVFHSEKRERGVGTGVNATMLSETL